MSSKQTGKKPVVHALGGISIIGTPVSGDVPVFNGAKNAYEFVSVGGVGRGAPFYSAEITLLNNSNDFRSLHLTLQSMSIGDVQAAVPETQIYSDLTVRVGKNDLDQDLVITLKKGVNDTALTLTIPAMTPDVTITSTGSEEFTKNDLIAFSTLTAAAAGSIAIALSFNVEIVEGSADLGILSIDGDTEQDQFFEGVEGIEKLEAGNTRSFGIEDGGVIEKKIGAAAVTSTKLAVDAISGQAPNSNPNGTDTILDIDFSTGNLAFTKLNQLARFSALIGSPNFVNGSDVNFFAFTGQGGNGDVDQRQAVIPIKCVLRNFTVFVKSTSKTTNTAFTIMKNGLVTGLSIVFASGEDGVKTLVAGIQVNAGDLISCRLSPSGSNNITFGSFSVEMSIEDPAV